ncbi:MAG: hypothetical protein ACOWWM_12125 [Desulfobacterales bacterium]
MEYYCNNQSCTGGGNVPFRLTLPPEACIDEHNCATVFCPHCQGKMSIADGPEPAGADR